MKAAIVNAFGPVEDMTVMDVADPTPGPGEVLIDVAAADVNYPDLLVIEGKYQIKPPLPFAPGKAVTGRIAALGDGVTEMAAGDRVIAYVEYGAYAEKVVAPAQSTFPLPEPLDFARAAASALTYQTAYFALFERARFTPGDTVLVLGASGGVGMAAVQLAQARGAGRVIGTARGKAGCALAREAGCDAVIDVANGDLREGLRQGVRDAMAADGADATGGVDIVIDPLGGDYTAAAMRAMAWCGRLVVIGFAAGDIPALRSNYLLLKNIAVLGLQWSDYRDRTPAKVAAAQAEINEHWQEGRLHPQMTDAFPLDGAARALADLRDGRIKGKIVLTTDAGDR